MCLLRRIFIAVFGETFLLRAFQRKAMARTVDEFGAVASCLDVGAGDLGLTFWLRRRHPKWQIVACDLQFGVEAKQRAAVHRIEAVVTDGTWLPSVPGGYDLVLISSVLQMVPDPTRFLAQCRAVLKPSAGRMLITVPAPYHFLPCLAEARGSFAAWVRDRLQFPDRMDVVYAKLRQEFGAKGPRDRFHGEEIVGLLEQNGFVVHRHDRTPGWLGTLAWETTVALSRRWGPRAHALMAVSYPLVWLENLVDAHARIGEHLLVVSPRAVLEGSPQDSTQ